MITAHMTVNIESRNQKDPISDIIGCLEALTANLRECPPELVENISDTLYHNGSEINYLLVKLENQA